MRSFMKMIPLLLLIAAAAWAQEVRYNYDRSADFSNYHTYAWAPSPANVDQLTDQEIRGAIDKQLAEKGLVRVTENPDLLVRYQLTVTEEPQFETWGQPGWATTTVTAIPVGTLVVDMYDPARQQLVWRGVATKTLSSSSNPDKRMKKLDKTMDKLFKHYPPEEKG